MKILIKKKNDRGTSRGVCDIIGNAKCVGLVFVRKACWYAPLNKEIV